MQPWNLFLSTTFKVIKLSATTQGYRGLKTRVVNFKENGWQKTLISVCWKMVKFSDIQKHLDKYSGSYRKFSPLMLLISNEFKFFGHVNEL